MLHICFEILLFHIQDFRCRILLKGEQGLFGPGFPEKVLPPTLWVQNCIELQLQCLSFISTYSFIDMMWISANYYRKHGDHVERETPG